MKAAIASPAESRVQQAAVEVESFENLTDGTDKREVIAELGEHRLIIGGKSLGGRMASLIADEVGARGLVCLGYPFHPPGKPQQLRTAHLVSLRTPTLIDQGTRDPGPGTGDRVSSAR